MVLAIRLRGGARLRRRVLLGRWETTSGVPQGAAPTPTLVAQGGTQEGELVTYVADFEDGHSERWQSLKLANGTEVKLAFDEAPALPYGTKVRITGSPLGQSLHVDNLEVLSSPTETVQAAPVTQESPPSPDTYGLVLVDLGGGVNIDAGSAETTMFSSNPTDKSFASFYFESSYGKYSVTGAVLGPFPFTMTTCDTTGMETAIEPQITTPFNHLIYYFNRTNLCTFGGLGEEGSVNAPAKRTWMNGSLSCVVLMQEPGHNLGLMHANTMTCGTAAFSTTPATSCTITEYGSTMTPMGSGCHQLNGYEKWYEQWLTGCNGVRVPSTGTFSIVPLGDSCPGAVQVLQVPMPATLTVNDPQATTTNVSLKDYYVELRATAGSFDGYNAAGRGAAATGVTYTGPTVFVYTSDDVHTGAAPARGATTPTRNSVWTELLNMTPGSTSFTGLTAAGQSFQDPAGGATITLQSISATGAIIGVTVPNGTGSPTCIDGTTLAGSGSACDGGAVVIPPFEAGTIIPPPLSEAGVADSGGDASSASAPDATTGGGPRDAAAGGAVDTGTGTTPTPGSGTDAASVAIGDAGSAGQPTTGGGATASDSGAAGRIRRHVDVGWLRLRNRRHQGLDSPRHLARLRRTGPRRLGYAAPARAAAGGRRERGRFGLSRDPSWGRTKSAHGLDFEPSDERCPAARPRPRFGGLSRRTERVGQRAFPALGALDRRPHRSRPPAARRDVRLAHHAGPRRALVPRLRGCLRGRPDLHRGSDPRARVGQRALGRRAVVGPPVSGRLHMDDRPRVGEHGDPERERHGREPRQPRHHRGGRHPLGGGRHEHLTGAIR